MRCFSLKLVEMNGLSVGGFFFGMVICGPSVVFSACFFGGYDGCQSADRGCGWFGGVGVVEAFCSVGMGVGVGGVGNRGGSVVSGGRDASVADGGADGEGARWRICCRFPDGIFRELREDLPNRLPFMLDIVDFFS